MKNLLPYMDRGVYTLLSKSMQLRPAKDRYLTYVGGQFTDLRRTFEYMRNIYDNDPLLPLVKMSLNQEIYLNLELSRKIIIDDSYPVYHDYTSLKPLNPNATPEEEQRWITEVTLGYYQGLTTGRRLLVGHIGYYKHEPAIPELREILLHDLSPKMKYWAIDALRQMPSMKSALVINEALSKINDRNIIDHLLHFLAEFPCPFLADTLVDLYEQNCFSYLINFDYKKEWHRQFHQKSIHFVAVEIRSLKILEIFKKGMADCSLDIRKSARMNLELWLDNMAPWAYSEADPAIFKTLKKIIWEYELGDLYWNMYKKPGKEIWQRKKVTRVRKSELTELTSNPPF